MLVRLFLIAGQLLKEFTHASIFISSRLSIVIKDTKAFLRKWRGLSFVPDTALIGTIDVVGLYPYISHFKGLEALRTEMENGNTKVPAGNLYNLAKLVLENNYFEFDKKCLPT